MVRQLYMNYHRRQDRCIRNIEVLLPKHVEEREKINIYFENLDNLITLQQQELDGYKEFKKGLLQQMLC